MKSLTEAEAFNRAAARCSTTEYCKYDMTRKLSAWGLAFEVIEHILEQLEKEKFIDEKRYCQAFIHDKILYSKWGKIKIRQALQAKNIPSNYYNSLLEEFCSETESYQNNLHHLLETKARTIKASSEYERKTKLFRFALSRGFEAEDIYRYLNLEEE